MKKIILTCFVLVISISIVNAFGVASPYWKENPLKISPGESKNFSLNLQNVVGKEDMNIKVSLISDGEGIAKLTEGEKNYLVKVGTYDTYVLVEIKIPSNSEYRTTEVKIDFVPITVSQGNMVDLSTKFTQIIPIEIIKEGELTEKSEPVKPIVEPAGSKVIIFFILSVIISVIILILIFLLIKFLTKKKSEKEKVGNLYQKERTEGLY